MKRTAIIILVFRLSCTGFSFTQPDTLEHSRTTEFFPILSYDADVGFGYGAKVFALNHFGLEESFDLVLFNSTKGERWYRLVFSHPDFERRQQTAYPFAIDVVIDYDKWIANSFFGTGNTARFEDKETYTREPFEIGTTVSRGFTDHLVGQVGLKYKVIRNFNFSPTSRLSRLLPSLNSSRVSYSSLVFLLRHDTRDSFINPATGMVVSGEVEHAPQFALNDVSFTRVALLYQHYVGLPFHGTVLSTRIWIQALADNDLPVQVLLPIGGNNTLRGSPQDRFLDNVAALCNLELRFPIFWKFGGVTGFDAGKVWRRTSVIDFGNWATNPVVGIRFSMMTFIVRLDVGVGREVTCFYFNFGHMF